MDVDVTDVGAILIGLIGAIWGIAKTLLDRHDKQAGITRTEFDALKEAVNELAYMRLAERHHRYKRRGWAHPNEKRICTRLYEAYHSIGGNGVGTALLKDIQKLPSYPPNENGASDPDYSDEEAEGNDS
ncbi:hypothetical protein [Bifidobacterium cuniculi]|uniref:Phage minor structural protein n=1 Tax=Bifidobacterium cuniculi TaxID=1688 RepID=A0A087AWA6_9BIFI|nr:hypothetical protein [Bifidobacterium cuniculi]KFI63056.1 hypothetical protein BCUN_0889 [Bifidobacterium cuniculi]